ncbi:MAG: hypothetical protein KBC73_21895 [Burkholderiaceae bacterium]|nr:hypothetical protein [Burkholderiaceae bacterium]
MSQPSNRPAPRIDPAMLAGNRRPPADRSAELQVAHFDCQVERAAATLTPNQPPNIQQERP